MAKLSHIFARIKPYLALVAGLAIIGVIIFFAPWHEISEQLRKLTPAVIVALAACSLTYYAAKAARYWLMLRALGVKASFGAVGLAYLSAQPVSLLPGGELYRAVTLKQLTGVPIKSSASTVTFQSIIESVVLAAGALAGAFTLGKHELAISIIAILILLMILALRFEWLTGLDDHVDKIPLLSVNKRQYRKFLHDHKVLLTGRNFGILLILTIIPVAAGTAIVYIAAAALGSQLSWGEASIAYCLPVIVSGISMLPGGLGASEGGMIGVLRLMNVATPAAFSITLITRIFTLGASLVIGLGALGVSHWRRSS